MNQANKFYRHKLTTSIDAGFAVIAANRIFGTTEKSDAISPHDLEDSPEYTKPPQEQKLFSRPGRSHFYFAG